MKIHQLPKMGLPDIRLVAPIGNEDDDFYNFDLCHNLRITHDMLVGSIGEIQLKYIMGDHYTGDYFYILFNQEYGYGYARIGYGTCSGCDALYRCESFYQLDNLRNSIFNDIHWEGDKLALSKWMIERDWQTQWEYHEYHTEEFAAFLAKSLLFLNGIEEPISNE